MKSTMTNELPMESTFGLLYVAEPNLKGRIYLNRSSDDTHRSKHFAMDIHKEGERENPGNEPVYR
jgi:hypothetical protein